MLYLARELSKMGVENYIVARKGSPLMEMAEKYSIPRVNLPYLFEFDIISPVMLALKINKINRKKKKVIIHTHTGHTSTVAILTRILIDAKIVAHRRVDFKLRGFFSRIKYNNVDVIIAISEAVKKVMNESKIHKPKIFVVPSSIPDDFINRDPKPRKLLKKDIIVGSLISLVDHKDPLNLIEAARLVVKDLENVSFEIGGDGYLMSKCKEMIREYDLEGKVIMKGYIDDNRGFLERIDLFVLPSQEEGLGSALIEAMAYGLPLVGTDAGGIKEIIKDGVNGFIVPKKDPVKLSQAIMRIITDESLYEEFSRKSLELAKGYTSHTMAAETLKIYEETIKDPSSY